MNNHSSNLSTLYRSILESTTDSVFYQNIHGYIDFIVKTPQLSRIIENDEEKYNLKYKGVWKDKALNEKEADEKEEQMLRFEQFSVYVQYSFLYERIYKYIEGYKNHTELDERPYPEAIVMLRGINGISTNLWKRDTLGLCAKWYVNRRKDYESRLQKLNNILLLELGKLVVKEEIPLKFDIHTGDFTFNNIRGNFSPKSQEYKIVSKLIDSPNNQTTFLYLLQQIYPNLNEVTKTKKALLYIAIRRINIKFGESLVKNVPNSGYRLIFQANKAKSKQV